MWEAVSKVLTDKNAIYVFVTAVTLAVLLGIFAKLGIISVHKKGLRIGKNTALNERIILRKQLEYVQQYCLALEPQLAKLFEKRSFRSDGAKVYYFKYLASLISNEVEQWVVVNNITQAIGYVQTKKIELKAFILSQVGNCPYSEQTLDRKIGLWVQEIVEHLNTIRRTTTANG